MIVHIPCNSGPVIHMHERTLVPVLVAVISTGSEKLHKHVYGQLLQPMRLR